MRQNKKQYTCAICKNNLTNVYYDDPLIIACYECDNFFRVNYSKKIIDNYRLKISMPDIFAEKMRNNHHYSFIEKNIGFKNVKSILEIGPGDGSLMKFILTRQKGIEYTVIEPSTSYCEQMRRVPGVKVINDFLENVEISLKFDLVIMSHVLEHIQDPKRTIKFIYDNVLIETGFLYIDVPNMDYELRNKYAARVAPDMHLHFFTGNGIEKLLINVGFNNVIKGNKYCTLSKSYTLAREKSGKYHLNILKIILYKLLSKLYLYIYSLKLIVNGYKVKEISLHESNIFFNNIAIIVSK